MPAVDIEQVLIDNPFTYGLPHHDKPLWPPEVCVLAIHWWGRTADKLVMARPVWFKIAIWIEVVVQAPFYLLAIYAFVRQRSWIRVPAIIYSTVLLTIMPIVLAEQWFGQHATHKPLVVTFVYAIYVIMPCIVLVRVWDVEVFSPPAVAGAVASSNAATSAARPGRRSVSRPRAKKVA